MMEHIPKDFINFALVLVFSLLIGLEQRRHHYREKQGTLYGTDRTHVFIGLLGYVLYVISPHNFLLFAFGGSAIVLFLGIFYWKKIETRGQFGITSMIVVLITYNLAPLLYEKPIWLTVSLVTTVLIFTELKQSLYQFSRKFEEVEFITLAKFLLISGIILPLLPHQIINTYVPVSPFMIWMAVVVISGISYVSYLIQKFLFPKKGMMITGVLGGMYSSTATSVVLARRSKGANSDTIRISSAIMLATAMMFLRLLVITFIFNASVAYVLITPFVSLSLLSVLMSWLILKLGKQRKEIDFEQTVIRNPLEFKTALLFAVLFVFFALLTKLVMKHFGNNGLDALSLMVGVTDITPFLLSLFTGKYLLSVAVMAHVTLIAVTSNNLIKLIYVLWLGGRALRKPMIISFSVVILVTVLFIVV